MNVYNEAHNLAAAIKECDEFKVYIESKNKINEHEDLSKMINDFHKQQMEFQMKQMAGEKVGPEDAEGIQKLYSIIAADPIAAEYLQAEMRFSLMMNDVYKIINDVVGVSAPEGSDVAK